MKILAAGKYGVCGTVSNQAIPLVLYGVNELLWGKDFQRMYCFHKRINFHVQHHLFDTHFGVFPEEGEWLISGEAAEVHITNCSGGVQ